METERIDILDDLIHLGCGKKTITSSRSFRVEQHDQLKLDIEHERETREIIVTQMESFLSSHHPNNPTSVPSSSSSSTVLQHVIFTSVEYFQLFSELFLVLVESCRYEVESLRKLFRLSSYFELLHHLVVENRVAISKSLKDLHVSLKSLLRGLHIWNNIPFWMDCVHDLTRYDLLLIEKVYTKLISLQQTHAGLETLPFLGLSKSRVIALVIFTRIQAVVSSMRSVGLGKESIDSFIQAVNQKYKLEEHGFDLLLLSSSKSASIRGSAGATTLLPSLSLSSGTSQLLNNALEIFHDLETTMGSSFSPSQLYESIMTQIFQSEVTQATSSKAKKKYQLMKFGFAKTLNVHDIGYTALVPLLMIPAVILAFHSDHSIRRHDNKSLSTKTCLCGDQIYAWNFCGAPSLAEVQIFQKIEKLLALQNKNVARDVTPQRDRLLRIPCTFCEHCYRALFADPTTYHRLEMAIMGICPVFGSTSSSIDADDCDEDLALDSEEEVGRPMGLNPTTRSSALSVSKLGCFERVLMKIYYDVEMAPSPTRVLSKRMSPVKKSSTVQNTKLQAIDEDSLADRFDALELNTNQDIPQNRARSTSGDSVMTNATSASGSSSGRFQNRPLPKTPAVITNALPSVDLHRHTTNVHTSSHPSPPPLVDETDSNSKRISNETAATEDSPSIAPESTILGDIQPLTSVEFQDFFKRLWRGTSVNVVYSMNPLVEKTRLLFLRSDAATNNDLLVDRIKNHRTNPLLEWVHRRINQGDMVPLFLGWAHRSEAGNLMHDITKSLSMQTIINVKIGSKKYENCIKITGHTKVIVIKIDGDEAKLQLIVRGLTQLAILVSPTFQKLA